MQIKDVKAELNIPPMNFDAWKLEESEKKQLQKNKLLLVGATALTVGAAVLSKGLRLRKKVKNRRQK